jgi:glycosyltransferase involved in cell wall biosynthesis
MPSPCDAPVIGYVLKMFPRLSETFIVTEIVARERRGEHIEIASLRAPVDGRFHANLADIRGSVTWILDDVRSGDRLWTTMAAARHLLPRFDAAVAELLAARAGDAVQAVEVARWALERGVDHLHAHFATTATLVARLASQLTGLPYSFTAHAKDIFQESVDEDHLGRALRDAHHTVTVSEYNVEYLSRRFPDVTQRLRRVYNGLDLDALRPRPRGASAPTLVAVGRLVEKKGFADLIDAVAVLYSRGIVLPTRIAGAGPVGDALRRQIVESGLENVVELVGPLTQTSTHDLIAEGTIFAAPAVVAADGDRDGLPTVLLEAMALGTPVVATAVTGIPEAVVDGETGLLVPDRDPFALADAIQRLLDDAALRTRLSRAARSLLERRFDVRTQAAELAELCRRRVASYESVTA